jgi:hypothetical protein
MKPAGTSVARTLPIDGALLGDVMLRLRRDTPASLLRWTLGDRGTAEVDACFTSAGPAWTTNARLWNRAGLAVIPATLQLVATGVDEVCLTLEPTVPPVPPAELLDLARAALDELAEEILWHATRAGLTQGA